MANLSHGAGVLPFQRGSTYGHGVINMTSTTGSQLEGTVWELYDPTKGSIKLRVVRNSSGATINKSKNLLAYASGGAGKRVSGVASAGAAACVADSAYADGTPIPNNDLFYVVEEGVVDVAKATGTSTAIALHKAVSAGASGVAVVSTAGVPILGYAAAAAADGDAVVSVYVG